MGSARDSEGQRVVIIGAGIGGLTAAALLAARGVPVTVVERMAAPGGKLRTVDCGGLAVDAGPTVFTARWIFEALFADCGARLADHLSLTASDRLARHAWADGSSLDLWSETSPATQPYDETDAIWKVEQRIFHEQALVAIRDLARTRKPRWDTLDWLIFEAYYQEKERSWPQVAAQLAKPVDTVKYRYYQRILPTLQQVGMETGG